MIPRHEGPYNISAIFNKFAGREVPMKGQKTQLKKSGEDRGTYEMLVPADGNDPTLLEMNEQAKKLGLELLVYAPFTDAAAFPQSLFWTQVPASVIDAEYDSGKDFKKGRLIAEIEKAADGKYRVSNKFKIG